MLGNSTDTVLNGPTNIYMRIAGATNVLEYASTTETLEERERTCGPAPGKPWREDVSANGVRRRRARRKGRAPRTPRRERRTRSRREAPLLDGPRDRIRAMPSIATFER